MRDSIKTIGNIIDKQSYAYISSIDEDGYPTTKAMYTPRLREGITHLYFTTNTSSMRVRQYRANPKACIYFSDTRFFRGVMLKGAMEVLEEDAIKRQLWQDGDKLYYPKGVTDPDYCILKFTAVSGRYYSHFKSEEFIVLNDE